MGINISLGTFPRRSIEEINFQPIITFASEADFGLREDSPTASVVVSDDLPVAQTVEVDNEQTSDSSGSSAVKSTIDGSSEKSSKDTPDLEIVDDPTASKSSSGDSRDSSKHCSKKMRKDENWTQESATSKSSITLHLSTPSSDNSRLDVKSAINENSEKSSAKKKQNESLDVPTASKSSSGYSRDSSKHCPKKLRADENRTQESEISESSINPHLSTLLGVSSRFDDKSTTDENSEKWSEDTPDLQIVDDPTTSKSSSGDSRDSSTTDGNSEKSSEGRYSTEYDASGSDSNITGVDAQEEVSKQVEEERIAYKRKAFISSDKSTPSSIKIDTVVINPQSTSQVFIPVPKIIMSLSNQGHEEHHRVTNINITLPSFRSDPKGEDVQNQPTQPEDDAITEEKDSESFLPHEDQNRSPKQETSEASSSKSPSIDDNSKVVESSVTSTSDTEDETVTITITIRTKKAALLRHFTPKDADKVMEEEVEKKEMPGSSTNCRPNKGEKRKRSGDSTSN